MRVVYIYIYIYMYVHNICIRIKGLRGVALSKTLVHVTIKPLQQLKDFSLSFRSFYERFVLVEATDLGLAVAAKAYPRPGFF